MANPLSLSSLLESDQSFYKTSLLSLLFITLPTYISCKFIKAPYGRHVRTGWGPHLPPFLAWFLMESPTILLSFLIFPYGRHVSSLKSLSLLAVFLLHYLHRVFIYPLRLRRTATGYPVSIFLIALFFNVLNTYVQVRWVSHYGDYGNDEWFWARFWAGLGVFVIGMRINVKSDGVLVGLKAQGGGYKIPRGGLFELVSCPNYLGEIVEWLGWALMTWCWAGLGFFLYTCSNLVPRACDHHKWYLEKFGEDYPKQRKAIIPFVY